MYCIPVVNEKGDRRGVMCTAYLESALESRTWMVTSSGISVPNSFSTARGSRTLRAR